MKLREGNSYVCIKECKDVKGRKIPAGAICYTSKGILLHGYNEDSIYTQVEPMDDYREYFTLYEESPYNKEQKELREMYAGMAMQAFITNGFSENSLPKDHDEARHHLARVCIQIADALIEELSKEE